MANLADSMAQWPVGGGNATSAEFSRAVILNPLPPANIAINPFSLLRLFKIRRWPAAGERLITYP
jgi:hypothetical protein